MPQTKPWTVLLYIVARIDGLPGNIDDRHYMNTKADEVVKAIKSSAAGRNIYVAYNVIYDPADLVDEHYFHKEPFAEILNPDLSVADPTHDGWFSSLPPNGAANSQLTRDLFGFYDWALKRCPSNRLAVFFWGHSFGPAGLFEKNTEVILPDLQGPLQNLPPLSVVQYRGVLAETRTSLRNGNKVDVVFFQDCWMSTLETAFQIKDGARFAVASQSLVPFGRPSVANACNVTPYLPGGLGVWPYGQLFDLFDALSQSGSNGISVNNVDPVTILGSFYQNDTRQMWPNPSVPFALLDLEKIDLENLGGSISMLVSALEKLGKQKKRSLLEKASLAVAAESVCVPANQNVPKTELAAGSIALVDLKTLCAYLNDESLAADEKRAVRQLLESRLVVNQAEPFDKALKITRPDNGNKTELIMKPLGFQGISIFCYPTEDRTKQWGNRDEFIFNTVASNRNFYDTVLELSKDTDWEHQAFDVIINP